MLLLALLVTVVYAYWFLTNDARIAAQAERYLRNLTRCHVEIRQAKFSLFGGVELTGVRIRIPGDESQEPLFQARRLLLHHRPWSLFVRRRLEPTEIVCLDAILTLVWDASLGQYTVQKLFADRLRAGAIPPVPKVPLPVIRARNLRLRQITGEVVLHLAMLPREGWVYHLSLEEDRPGEAETILSSVLFNVATGETTLLTGSKVPHLARLDQALPEQLQRWRKRYSLDGKVLLKGRAGAPAPSMLEAELVNVSLKLPGEQGGLDLTGVCGTLVLDKGGLTLRRITGKVAQAADARFEVSGRYEGYEVSSPFEVSVRVWGMHVPPAGKAPATRAASPPPPGRGLNDVFASLRRMLRPAGRFDLAVDFKRSAEGTLTYSGQASLQNMSMTYEDFPYRVEDIAGRVWFSPDLIELRGLTAKRNGATFRVDGRVHPQGGHDVTVEARDVLLDAEFGRAMPKGFEKVWRTLQPGGRTSGTVHVSRTGRKPQRISVKLIMDGKASMTYRPFPYRVENIRGQVRFEGGRVRIDHVAGRRGPMQCTIHGTIDAADTARPEVDVTITASDLPLDETLTAALDESRRAGIKALNPGGSAKSITAYLRQSGGGKLTYEITVMLAGASFRPSSFPYAITDATGVLTIYPHLVDIRDLRGRHGKTPVHIKRGKVLLWAKDFGLDLQEVAAPGMAFDQDLYRALPAALQKVWRQLSPSGRADVVNLALRYNVPGKEGKFDYRLVLSAKGLQITYRDFPYPLRGVAGTVVATPGRVVLRDIVAAAGKMRASLSGSIVTQQADERLDLSIRAGKIPIDATLLGAMPKEFASLIGRLKPGGTCDIEKLHLELRRRSPAPPAAPDGKGAPRTATAPAGAKPAGGRITWTARGAIAFHDAAILIGKDHKTFTGRLSGTVGRSPEGVSLSAEVALDTLLVGERRLENLRGRVTKSARSSVVRIDDLVATLHGGRVSGLAEIRLTEPPRYGVFLSLEGLKLEELFAATAEKSDVRGLLAGNIQLTGTVDKPGGRKASGVFQITKAKMYKLPVLMGLLNVIYLALPGEGAFTRGQLTYRVIGNELIFDEIFLDGPALSMVGSGKMNLLSEKLKLTFLAGPPGKLPRLASLDELLSPIIRELIEYQVTGTLAKPRIRVVTFKGLDAAIRKLLSPGQQ